MGIGMMPTVSRKNPMLVLSRKIGERILIGDKIAVTVVRIGQGGVRIGVDAPSDMVVVREELAGPAAVVASPGGDSQAKTADEAPSPRMLPR
jgi:carbon storage regulator